MLISRLKLWYLALKRRQNQPSRGVLKEKDDTKIDCTSGPSFLLANKTCADFQVPVLLQDITSKHMGNNNKKHMDVSLIVINHTMVSLFTFNMTMLLLKHPTQRRHLNLLSWEPSGFPCVNCKERVNLPAKRLKKWIPQIGSSTTTTKNVPFFHFQLQLTSALVGIYTAAKQTSLLCVWPWWINKQHDHEDWGSSASNHAGCQSCQQQSTSTYLSIYLVFAPIALITVTAY